MSLYSFYVVATTLEVLLTENTALGKLIDLQLTRSVLATGICYSVSTQFLQLYRYCSSNLNMYDSCSYKVTTVVIIPRAEELLAVFSQSKSRRK